MPSTGNSGPFLVAAFFCEKVLVENSGVKSAIRIVDRVTYHPIVPAITDEPIHFDYDTNLFVSFKSGRARGVQEFVVEMQSPDGQVKYPLRCPINFEGDEDRGVDTVIQMKINFELVGLYWFAIKLNDALVTKVPFRFIYLPQIRESTTLKDGPPER